MSVNAQAYLKATAPHTPYYHLDDETLALQLDTSARHSKAARKAQEKRRQRRAEQQVAMERETQA